MSGNAPAYAEESPLCFNVDGAPVHVGHVDDADELVNIVNRTYLCR